MIVKNESKVIGRLLESTLPLIDSFVICDTGSTDDTISIIQSFLDRHPHLVGKIYEDQSFRDFGYNRTLALQKAFNFPHSEYILLLDADMVLYLGSRDRDDIISFKKSLLNHDAYYVYQGQENMYYKNIRLVRNDSRLKYWGVTHEYLERPDDFRVSQIEKKDLFIVDVGDGGSKQDKFQRDIMLLESGLIELPNNDRYLFYLANSYRDSNQHEKAIENYQKRISVGGWKEEQFYSAYQMGKIYETLGNQTAAIFSWMDAYEYQPNRIENLYHIVKTYRILGKHKIAYKYWQWADQIKQRLTEAEKMDFLFMEQDVYEVLLDYEWSILVYYCCHEKPQTMEIANKMIRLFIQIPTHHNLTQNMLTNYKFYAPLLPTTPFLFPPNIGQSLLTPTELSMFVSSTPTFCRLSDHSDEMVLCVRFVNYSIDENGQYHNPGTIETINILVVVDIAKPTQIIKEMRVRYNTAHDLNNTNKYIGLEDIRLMRNPTDSKWDTPSPTKQENYVVWNANRGHQDSMSVEHGILDISTGNTESYLLESVVGGSPRNTIEKNWVMFPDKDTIKFVYGWHPLTIGHCSTGGSSLVIDRQINTPDFFKYCRGSTNGILVKEEIWFLVHVVVYESRRYYYHMFVTLHVDSWEIARCSTLFTFAGQPVEYALGLEIFAPGIFMVGYSIMDRSTHFATVNVHDLDMMVVSLPEPKPQSPEPPIKIIDLGTRVRSPSGVWRTESES